MAARIVWKAEERLIAMMASQLSSGKSSIGDTRWMPALLTSTSTLPSLASASAIMAAISAGFDMSAGEWRTVVPNSSARPARVASMAAGSPKPLSITPAPSRASARATARPMPLVEPVTRALREARDMGGLRGVAVAGGPTPDRRRPATSGRGGRSDLVEREVAAVEAERRPSGAPLRDVGRGEMGVEGRPGRPQASFTRTRPGSSRSMA